MIVPAAMFVQRFTQSGSTRNNRTMAMKISTSTPAPQQEPWCEFEAVDVAAQVLRGATGDASGWRHRSRGSSAMRISTTWTVSISCPSSSPRGRWLSLAGRSGPVSCPSTLRSTRDSPACLRSGVRCRTRCAPPPRPALLRPALLRRSPTAMRVARRTGRSSPGRGVRSSCNRNRVVMEPWSAQGDAVTTDHQATAPAGTHR